MKLKEDIKEAKQRMAAFWEGETIDRPVIAYKYQRSDIANAPALDFWYLAKIWDDIDGYIKHFEQHAESQLFGGEYIPNIQINYGAGVMAAIFGCVPKFVSKSVWFEHSTSIHEIVTLLESAQLNESNEWYHRLINVTEKAAAAAQRGGYAVSMTDLGGILDILASFLTPSKLIVAMKTQPSVIDTCRAIIMDKWHRLYSDLMQILDAHNLGCTGWLNVWSPKHWYPIQCDFCAMLSPKWFQRFVLPDLKEQCDRLDYCIYHWDGPNQLQYKDDLLSISNLSGLQWCPGINQPTHGADLWMPLYQDIQAANKFIVEEAEPTDIAKLYRNLNPKKTYTISKLGTQIMAEFYLPKFAGGMDAIEEE
jgi:5-methyltetrahydrofolate--homocysteine methyltransferase